ncbi:hypothetical protein [Streptomyces sp. NPDC046261]|uniref:hypothetical protein n=1 Tax=Streptomyces sp. NPDC046261 TaxID=3157200 RepID=UPI0033ED3E56
MGNNRLHTAAVAVVCGSLAVGVCGPALASGRAADSIAVAEPAPAPAGGRADSIGSLGETLSLGSRFLKEARSRTPDVDYLRDLRQRLRESADRLLVDVRARAQAPYRHDSARDPVADVKAQLDKLVKDVDDLLAAVLAKDAAKVTALVAQVLADLQALLTSVPKLVGGAAPLPVPLPG